MKGQRKDESPDEFDEFDEALADEEYEVKSLPASATTTAATAVVGGEQAAAATSPTPAAAAETSLSSTLAPHYSVRNTASVSTASHLPVRVSKYFHYFLGGIFAGSH